MRTLPLIALLSLACHREDPPSEVLTGTVGGRAFAATTVAFDEVGAAPGDSAAPDERLAEVVLVDAPEACPLLGPLYHLLWLRCASACEGLLAAPELWPDGTLRTLWIGVTAGESTTGHYDLGMNDSPGVFTVHYRAADLGRLEGLDATGCLAACSEDHDFLWSGTDDGQWGELEVDIWDEQALEGTVDLLLSTGELQGRFTASRCGMGLY